MTHVFPAVKPLASKGLTPLPATIVASIINPHHSGARNLTSSPSGVN